MGYIVYSTLEKADVKVTWVRYLSRIDPHQIEEVE